MANEKGTKGLPPALKALADPTRLKIMLMLEGRSRTVGEIVDFFELSQPTISRHLQTLTQAGLVLREKNGQHVHYAINPGSVRSVCVELATCFPCCCIAVSAPQGTAHEEMKPAEAVPRRRKKPSTRKG
jgi:DNA-binding transcriptional ArsR family regulator